MFYQQHVYDEKEKSFDKDGTVLNTCNQFNPAQYNPDVFQPVEQSDEEVSVRMCTGHKHFDNDKLDVMVTVFFHHILP